MLQIHNSLTGRKEAFRPIVPGEVRMYVCGMTVYDFCHLGHARMLIAFDVVRRHLKASGYRVTFVCNITDIDDKIIKRSAENGEPMGALTERFIRAYHEDCAALGIERADHEPRATRVPAADHRDGREPGREGLRVRRRQRRRLLLRREVRAVRAAVGQASRGPAGRGADRSGRGEA